MERTRQIALGPAIAALGALLLLVSLFVGWYEPGLTAWTVFEALDLVLAALSVATLVLAAHELGLAPPGRRVPAGALMPVAAGALAIVVSQIVNHPPAAIGRDPELGLWLALGATILLTIGALVGSSYVSVVRADAHGAPPAGSGEVPTEPLQRSGPTGPPGQDRPG